MIHRHCSIAIALASILAGGNATEVKIPPGLRATETAAKEDNDYHGWSKVDMTVEKGVKCKAGADKKKMGAGRECEGGVKKGVKVGLSARDLAEDLSSEIRDLRSSMSDSQGMLVPEETMMELLRWDETEHGELAFGEEDCSEDGGCEKTMEFGGFAKLFWGCNITFALKDGKMKKDVACGGKSFEGMGKKEDMGYDDVTKKEETYKEKEL